MAKMLDCSPFYSEWEVVTISVMTFLTDSQPVAQYFQGAKEPTEPPPGLRSNFRRSVHGQLWIKFCNKVSSGGMGQNYNMADRRA